MEGQFDVKDFATSSGRGRPRKLTERRNVINRVTDYWGRDFINNYGQPRQDYYKTRGYRSMPLPRGLIVPKNGITVDDSGRVTVRVLDSEYVEGMSIEEALIEVEVLMMKGYS